MCAKIETQFFKNALISWYHIWWREWSV